MQARLAWFINNYKGGFAEQALRRSVFSVFFGGVTRMTRVLRMLRVLRMATIFARTRFGIRRGFYLHASRSAVAIAVAAV